MNISSPNIRQKLTAASPSMTLARVAALGAVAVLAWQIQDSHRKHRHEKTEENHKEATKVDQFVPQSTPYVPPFVPGPSYGSYSPVIIPPPIFFDPFPGFYGGYYY